MILLVQIILKVNNGIDCAECLPLHGAGLSLSLCLDCFMFQHKADNASYSAAPSLSCSNPPIHLFLNTPYINNNPLCSPSLGRFKTQHTNFAASTLIKHSRRSSNIFDRHLPPTPHKTKHSPVDSPVRRTIIMHHVFLQVLKLLAASGSLYLSAIQVVRHQQDLTLFGGWADLIWISRGPVQPVGETVYNQHTGPCSSPEPWGETWDQQHKKSHGSASIIPVTTITIGTPVMNFSIPTATRAAAFDPIFFTYTTEFPTAAGSNPSSHKPPIFHSFLKYIGAIVQCFLDFLPTIFGPLSDYKIWHAISFLVTPWAIEMWVMRSLTLLRLLNIAKVAQVAKYIRPKIRTGQQDGGTKLASNKAISDSDVPQVIYAIRKANNILQARLEDSERRLRAMEDQQIVMAKEKNRLEAENARLSVLAGGEDGATPKPGETNENCNNNQLVGGKSSLSCTNTDGESQNGEGCAQQNLDKNISDKDGHSRTGAIGSQVKPEPDTTESLQKKVQKLEDQVAKLTRIKGKKDPSHEDPDEIVIDKSLLDDHITWLVSIRPDAVKTHDSSREPSELEERVVALSAANELLKGQAESNGELFRKLEKDMEDQCTNANLYMASAQNYYAELASRISTTTPSGSNPPTRHPPSNKRPPSISPPAAEVSRSDAAAKSDQHPPTSQDDDDEDLELQRVLYLSQTER